MTRDEARAILAGRYIVNIDGDDEYCNKVNEALDMAIEALSEGKVLCKDCKYYKKITEKSDHGLCHRDIVASVWIENGYCSRAERREP